MAKTTKRKKIGSQNAQKKAFQANAADSETVLKKSNDNLYVTTKGSEKDAAKWLRSHYYIPFFMMTMLVSVILLCKTVFLQDISQATNDFNASDNMVYEQIYFMDKIHRRAGLTLEEYEVVYDGKWPVLITDVLQHWPAFNWTQKFFINEYGNDRISMKAVQGNLDSAESFALPLNIFLSHIHEGRPQTWTYLEDELFIEQRPQLKKDLGTPIYLKKDWFQLFPAEIRPWNSMLLWGTQYSRSSLHIDPYNWTGTNAVFKGLKKWKLYPPGQDNYLYVIPDKKSEFPLNCYKYNSPVDAFNPDLKTYPLFKKAKALSFDQHPGELLLIPTGWFHQAYNGRPTMAVSSQVMNSGNYEIVLKEILKANDILKEKIPEDFYSMSPVQQVTVLMHLMPIDILDRGREINEYVLKEIEKKN